MAGVIAAAPHHRSGHGRTHTGRHFHHQTTGEIERPQTLRPQKAPRPPNHVGERQVDERAPQQHKQQPGPEIHPFHHGPGDQRRRDDRKGELEEGHRTMAELAIAIGCRPIAEARPLQATDERGQRTTAGGERQAVAEQHPEHAHQAHGREAHHHRVEHVAAAHKPGIKQRQGRRHHQHQGSTDEHKAIVGRVLCRIHSEQKQISLSEWAEPPARRVLSLVAKATVGRPFRVVRNTNAAARHKKRRACALPWWGLEKEERPSGRDQ